jgi:hypothetical protein
VVFAVDFPAVFLLVPLAVAVLLVLAEEEPPLEPDDFKGALVEVFGVYFFEAVVLPVALWVPEEELPLEEVFFVVADFWVAGVGAGAATATASAIENKRIVARTTLVYQYQGRP